MMTLRNFAFLYSASIILILAGVLLFYRQYVALPKIEQSLMVFQERELSTLFLALDREFSHLKTINYDYSVWTDTYEFIQKFNQEYVDDNYVDDTFTSLKIDGVFIYDLDFNQIWAKGYNYTEEEPIEFPELNLLNFPQNKIIYPAQNIDGIALQVTGLLNTSQGAVMLSATQVKVSDASGNAVGLLVLIRKIRPGLINSLAQFSQLKLSSTVITIQTDADNKLTLKGSLQGEGFTRKRQRILADIHKQPLLLLDIEHNQSELPNLFDNRTLLVLLLLTLIPLSLLIVVHRYLFLPVVSRAKFIHWMIETKEPRELKQNSKFVEFNNLIGDFNQLIHTIKQQQSELKKLTFLDALTGISNRRAYEEFLSKAWSSMQRNKLPLAILMCDIDFFKPYNDNMGHQAGDDTLRMVAQALAQRICRSCDLVARYGGEEFVIVIRDTSDAELRNVADIVLDSVTELDISHPHSKVSPILTISVGAAIFSDFSHIPVKQQKEDLLSAADKALYRAKGAGRNCAIFEYIKS